MRLVAALVVDMRVIGAVDAHARFLAFATVPGRGLLVVGGPVLHHVVGVEKGFFDEAENVVVVGSIEDPRSFTASAHQAAEA